MLGAERGTLGKGVKHVQVDTLATPRGSTLVRLQLFLLLPPSFPSSHIFSFSFSFSFSLILPSLLHLPSYLPVSPSLLSGSLGTPVPCERCECNSNADPLDCDPIEGRCLRCLFNTAGRQCEMCAPGFYGDAITAKNCTGKLACCRFPMDACAT